MKQKPKQTEIKGRSKAERLIDINTIAKDLRPIARVKAIVKSPNREKEHLVTLKALEKIDDEELLKKMSNGMSKKKVATTSGIFALPVSKKLPWMTISGIPDEFMKDIAEGKKPENRYYLVKMENWSASFIKPMCKVLSSIGEAGNLEAESLRILK